MLMTSHPWPRYQRDSARVEKRGPCTTTTVPGRRQLGAQAVAGEEGDAPAPDIPDGDGRGRRPVRRLERHLDRVVEKRVKTGTAEDPDLGLRRGLGHAILLSVFELLDDESEDDDSEEDDESDFEEEEGELLSFSFSFSRGLEDPLFPLLRLSVL